MSVHGLIQSPQTPELWPGVPLAALRSHVTGYQVWAWKGSDKVIASVKICNMGGTYLSLHLSEMALPFHVPES